MVPSQAKGVRSASVFDFGEVLEVTGGSAKIRYPNGSTVRLNLRDLFKWNALTDTSAFRVEQLLDAGVKGPVIKIGSNTNILLPNGRSAFSGYYILIKSIEPNSELAKRFSIFAPETVAEINKLAKDGAPILLPGNKFLPVDGMVTWAEANYTRYLANRAQGGAKKPWIFVAENIKPKTVVHEGHHWYDRTNKILVNFHKRLDQAFHRGLIKTKNSKGKLVNAKYEDYAPLERWPDEHRAYSYEMKYILANEEKLARVVDFKKAKDHISSMLARYASEAREALERIRNQDPQAFRELLVEIEKIEISIPGHRLRDLEPDLFK